MLQTKFLRNRSTGSREEVFYVLFFFIYGHGGHLGHVTWTIYVNSLPHFLRMLHMKFGFDLSSGFRGEDLVKLWTDDGPWPSAQVS